jgi:predicted PurR-regulated permease PerM
MKSGKLSPDVDMSTLVRLPFYAKASLLLIGLYVFIGMLSIAQGIILPVIYATLMAILISPVVNFLTAKKINRAVSIAVVLALALLLLFFLIASISAQASRLSEAWPQLTAKFQTLLNQSVHWASGYSNISPKKINLWIADLKGDMIDNSGAAIGMTITTMSGMLATVLLTPVYIFMILLYQPHLIEFIHKLFGAENDQKVGEILSETKTIIQGYLVGLFAELSIIAILNSMGLLILGIDYAILLGIIGAFLNIIPYLGGIIAMALFMIVALMTKSLVYVLYVVVLYTLIQLIDNNYIVPKIVGSKVKINALVCLIAVIAGAALWGIPGMFLSIPLLAVVKLVFDRVEPLKPWGFLLGDTIPPIVNLKNIAQKLPKVIDPFKKKQKL